MAFDKPAKWDAKVDTSKGKAPEAHKTVAPTAKKVEPVKKVEPKAEPKVDPEVVAAEAEATRLGWSKDVKGKYSHAGAVNKYDSARAAVEADPLERPVFGVQRPEKKAAAEVKK